MITSSIVSCRVPIRFLLCFVCSICIFSCNEDVVAPPAKDETLIAIPWEFDRYMYGQFTTGVWVDSTIYYANPLRSITLNSSFHIIHDTTLFLYARALFLHADKARKRILYVSSKYAKTSIGSLYEFDILTGKHTELLDSSFNISSAVYTPHNNNIIYYSFGQPEGSNAGYYQLDRTTGESTQLLAYQSEMGTQEVLNGFDLHPNGHSLLIPVTRFAKPPLIVRYSLQEKTFDTLNTPFEVSSNRMCLWLRYNSNGSKILYSQYPMRSFGAYPNDDSEIGVIDALSGQKTVIPVNPHVPYGAINTFPNWSPNEQHIVFGSATVLFHDLGVVSAYSLYIKRNFLIQ